MRRFDTLVSVVGKLKIVGFVWKKPIAAPMSFAEYFTSEKRLTALDIQMNEVYKGLPRTVEYVMYRLFCCIDADGSGMISKTELRRFLRIPENERAVSERGVGSKGGQAPQKPMVGGSDRLSGLRNDTDLRDDHKNPPEKVVINDVFDYGQLKALLDIFEANEHKGKELSLKEFISLMVKITKRDDTDGGALTVRGLFMIYAVLMEVEVSGKEKVELNQSKKKERPVELVITLNGIRRMFAECFPNQNPSQFVIRAMFNKVDVNRDNRLQFEEFKHLMKEFKEDGKFNEKDSKPSSEEEYFRENPDCLSDEQRAELEIEKDVEYAYYCHFCEMDKDGDRRLTLDEMANALGHLIDSPLHPGIVKEWLSKLKIKIDKDGLYFEDFLRLTKSAKEFKQAEARDLFNRLKNPTDDSITREAFYKYVRGLSGNNLSQASMDHIFNKLDTSRDGSLQFEELYEVLVKKDIGNVDEDI